MFQVIFQSCRGHPKASREAPANWLPSPPDGFRFMGVGYLLFLVFKLRVMAVTPVRACFETKRLLTDPGQRDRIWRGSWSVCGGFSGDLGVLPRKHWKAIWRIHYGVFERCVAKHAQITIESGDGAVDFDQNRFLSGRKRYLFEEVE